MTTDRFAGFRDRIKFLPGGKKLPIEVIVLRGHLLIERELQGLVAAKFARPHAFSFERVPSNAVAALAEALYGKLLPDWVWKEIKTLNVIRNSYAHHLTDETTLPRIKRLVASFREREPRSFMHLKDDLSEQMHYCIAVVHTKLMRVRNSQNDGV